MSDDFMKSALDRAMERADRIEIPQEKLKEMEHRSEGERIAAAFLKDPEYDVSGALAKYDEEAKKYISKSLESILLQNIVLPKKDSDMANTEKVFGGLLSLKKNKNAVQQAKEQLQSLSDYYVQARTQHFEQLKAQVEQMMRQTIQQQTGANAPANLNVEQTPEFQENWRQVSGKLDAEYDNALAQLKDQIASVD